MKSLLTTIFAFFFFLCALDAQGDITKVILVDKLGRGNFTAVQQAIDSIPPNNLVWTRIYLHRGLYAEKVVIPKEKPYIILEGDPKYLTVIEYGDSGSVVYSPTFKLLADNFVARNIIFKNTYDRLIQPNPGRKRTTWAPAASISGDKASFYRCSFLSLQDTLNDNVGRHYFEDCFIRGAIDFIWGFGQSIYERCRIKSVTDVIGKSGYITAQGRDNPKGTTGYVFKDCYVYGSGPIPTFLGRPYRPYARVLFANTYMENIITPEGWSISMQQPGSESLITFSEVNCTGPGANMSRRIPWEKKLSNQEVAYLTNPASFIDQEGWLGKQPN